MTSDRVGDTTIAYWGAVLLRVPWMMRLAIQQHAQNETRDYSNEEQLYFGGMGKVVTSLHAIPLLTVAVDMLTIEMTHPRRGQ